MRILHSSDWHLGAALRSHYDRSEELFYQVEHICNLAQTHQADLLLVAGDIFVRRKMLESTRRLAEILAKYVRQGLQVLLISGNHDDKEHFNMMRAMISAEPRQQECIYIIENNQLITINGVQFIAVPYPNVTELLEPYRRDAVGALKRNTLLSKAYGQMVQDLVAQLDPTKPAVLTAHINVAGVISNSEKEINYHEGILLERSALPVAPNLAYIALGHIHQCQQIKHTIPCYYSGSMERMDMGERDDEKFVLLVDVPDVGIANVTKIPLTTTAFYDITIPAAELAELPNRYPDLAKAFFRLQLNCQYGDETIVLQRQAREMIANLGLRCLDVHCQQEVIPMAQTAVPMTPQDYAATVLNYIYQEYFEDPDLLTLEERAKQLMREVHDAPTKN